MGSLRTGGASERLNMIAALRQSDAESNLRSQEKYAIRRHQNPTNSRPWIEDGEDVEVHLRGVSVTKLLVWSLPEHRDLQNTAPLMSTCFACRRRHAMRKEVLFWEPLR